MIRGGGYDGRSGEQRHRCSLGGEENSLGGLRSFDGGLCGPSARPRGELGDQDLGPSSVQLIPLRQDMPVLDEVAATYSSDACVRLTDPLRQDLPVFVEVAATTSPDVRQTESGENYAAGSNLYDFLANSEVSGSIASEDWDEIEKLAKAEVEEVLARDAAARLVNGENLRFARVCVIGQSRAGKSCLIDSILGREFTHSKSSTAGVEAGVYEVSQHYIEGQGTDWRSYDPADTNLHEAALARLLAMHLDGNKSLDHDSLSSVLDVQQKAIQEVLYAMASDHTEQVNIDVQVVGDSSVVKGREEHLSAGECGRSSISMIGVSKESQNTLLSKESQNTLRQYLQNKNNSDLGQKESLKLLLEDFGGQDCFYELYSILFSENSVFLLVFDMDWFQLSGQSRDEGLAYLRHWLLTVQIYCKRASIILVGTHRDKIDLPGGLVEINSFLIKHLTDHSSWKLVTKNLKLYSNIHDLCFFPVDNTLSTPHLKRDSVLDELLLKIQTIAEESEHLKYTIPLAWLKLLDKVENLKRTGICVLTRAAFQEICKESGFPYGSKMNFSNESGQALTFLSKLGLLLYHVAIPHLVIIRPSEFLFPYFTKVICDFELHSDSIPEHKMAESQHSKKFKKLKEYGILSEDLLEVFWRDLKTDSAVGGEQLMVSLKKLMVSLGLMVSIIKKNPRTELEEETKGQYLVPSILPLEKDPPPPLSACLTALAVFSSVDCVKRWEEEDYTSGYIKLNEVQNEVQVPDGVFSRLLGSLATFCQQTDPYQTIYDMKIKRNSGMFYLGGSKFAVINHRTHIGIYIVKGSGHEVSQFLNCQIKTILEEFLPGFNFLLVVPCTGLVTGGRNSRTEELQPESSNVFTVLTGKRGINARVKEREGIMANDGDHLTAEDLKKRFHDWIEQARGGALTDDEEKLIRLTAAEAQAVSTGTPEADSSSRLTGELSFFYTGKPIDAVLGLESIMNVDNSEESLLEYHQLRLKEVEGIKQELEKYAESSGVPDVQKAMEYILYTKSGYKEYDKSRLKGDETLNSFVLHDYSKRANLKLPEVAALRMYTTLVHKHMNEPLRDSTRRENCKPCPLAVTTSFAYDAVKKLRSLNVEEPHNTILWRGMRQREVTEAFMTKGGTEMGFMSATKKLALAVRYSLSRGEQDQTLLLFKIQVPIFTSSGAELNWISTFPQEDEVLFPPLTFLKPSGRKDHLKVKRGKWQIDITVVEVVPYLG